MNEKNLRPCPFCGGEAELKKGSVYLDDSFRVICTKCGVRTVPVLIDHPKMTCNGLDESTRLTEEQAAEVVRTKWNARADNV